MVSHYWRSEIRGGYRLGDLLESGIRLCVDSRAVIISKSTCDDR